MQHGLELAKLNSVNGSVVPNSLGSDTHGAVDDRPIGNQRFDSLIKLVPRFDPLVLTGVKRSNIDQ